MYVYHIQVSLKTETVFTPSASVLHHDTSNYRSIMTISYQSLWLQIIGGLIVALITIYTFAIYFVYSYWLKRGVVQDNPHTLIYNDCRFLLGKISFGEAFRDFYMKLKNNSVIGTYLLLNPQLIIADPDLIRIVMTKEFAHFHDRGLYMNEKLDPITEHLFTMAGNKWKNLRAKLTPTFTSGKLKYMFPTVMERGNELAEHLKEKAKGREVIDIKDIIGRFTTDSISATAFGINSNSIKNPNAEFCHWGKKALTPKLWKRILRILCPAAMKIFSISSVNAGVSNFFTSLFKESIEFRKANKIRKNDFFDLIMQLMDNTNVEANDGKETPARLEDSMNGKITEMQAIAQAFLFFLAGFETSSLTVTHCLFELAKNQDLQDKLRKEIKTVLEKDGEITYNNINEMSLLHKVICEALRKYPAVPMLNRICTKDIDLPNVNLHVKKGTKIIIPVLGLHCDPDIYPNPDKFDPERFNEENSAKRHQYVYLPFGEGPRICIGMRFGLMQSKIGVISALTDFKFTLGPNTPEVLQVEPRSFLPIYKNGVYLRIELV